MKYLGGLIAIAVLMSACTTSGSNTLGVPNATSRKDLVEVGTIRKAPGTPFVSVFGDSESTTVARIGQAQAAGLTPRFVVVSGTRYSHFFPVYSPIARSGNSLLVFAYRHLYKFPSNAKVLYSGSSKDITVTDLPDIGELPAPPRKREMAAKGCRGCMVDPTELAYSIPILRKFAGVRDPWQNDSFTPWAPTPKSVGGGGPSDPDLMVIITVTVTAGGGWGFGGGGGGGGECGGGPGYDSQPGPAKSASGVHPNDCIGGGGGGGGRQFQVMDITSGTDWNNGKFQLDCDGPPVKSTAEGGGINNQGKFFSLPAGGPAIIPAGKGSDWLIQSTSPGNNTISIIFTDPQTKTPDAICTGSG